MVVRHAGTVGLAVVLLGSLAACSKQEPVPTRAPDEPPEVVSVLGASWGSAPGELGRTEPEEGSPEGPKSFVVDAAGRVHVLDQVNQRIQSFDGGQSSGVIALPDRPFEDIELDAGGFLVLDLFETPAIVGIGLDAIVSGELPVPAEEVPEPGMVTALVKSSSGMWLEVEDEYLVQIGDGTGSAVEPSVVPGQLVDGGEVFRATLDEPKRLEIHKQATLDGEPAELAAIDFSHPVREPSLLARGAEGALWVVALLEHEQADPEAPSKQEHVLVILAPNGHELGRHTLPASDSVFEAYRSVRQGADGNFYVMQTTDVGLEILKVTP